MTDSEYLVPGAEVEFSGRGKLISILGSSGSQSAHIEVTDQHTGAKSHLFMDVNQMSVKPVAARHRALKPAQVWQTRDGMYFVRVSRKDIPYRLTPSDLSEESGLKTLDETTFFMKYPEAHLVFPNGSKRRLNGKTREHKKASLPIVPADNPSGNGRHRKDGIVWDTPPPESPMVGYNIGYNTP